MTLTGSSSAASVTLSTRSNSRFFIDAYHSLTIQRLVSKIRPRLASQQLLRSDAASIDRRVRNDCAAVIGLILNGGNGGGDFTR